MNTQPVNFITSTCAIDNNAFINEMSNNLVFSSPAKNAMTGDEILKAIRNKGFSLALIAEASNASLGTTSAVIHRHTTSKKIATNICKVIGKPLIEVFSDVPTYTNPAYITSKLEKEEKRAELQQLLAS